MPSMMRGAIQGGIGQGLEKAAGNIMNAYFMKKKLEVSQQVADAQKQKAQADTRRSDAYTNYLDRQGQLKIASDDSTWDEADRYLTSQAGKRARGPGSTANQLATQYAGGAGPSNPAAIVSPQAPDGPGSAPSPRGMAQAQANPAPAKHAPVVPSPAMPPIPQADPRSLLQKPEPFDMPMFGDHDAT